MLNSYYSNTRTGEVAYTPNQNAFAENSNVARPQVITTNHYGQQSYANSGTEHRVYGQRTNPSNSSRGNTYQYAQFCKRIRQDLLKISTQSLLDFAIGLDNAYKQGNTKAFIVREIPNLNIYAIKGPTKVCPEFKDFLVPLCVYRGGICTEFHPCGYNKTIKEKQIDSD